MPHDAKSAIFLSAALNALVLFTLSPGLPASAHSPGGDNWPDLDCLSRCPFAIEAGPIGSSVTLAAGTSLQEKWKAAIDALKRNDYETAFRELKPLAENGNAAAQYQLGLLYEGGKGVRKDAKEAAKWIREAAQQGITDAQIVLSNKYQNGEGVQKDLTEAYIWASLAANSGVRRAVELKNKLSKKLDPKQLEEAERSIGDRTGKRPEATRR